MEKAKFRRKNHTQKPIYSKKHLAMVVSGIVLERRCQGLFKSGPKNLNW